MTDSFLRHAVNCSLVDYLDRPLLVILRDQRLLIGQLITFDQYSNIVLNQCRERRILGNKYAEEDLGLFIIRGENIVMIGGISTDKLPSTGPNRYTKITMKELKLLESAELAKKPKLDNEFQDDFGIF